MSRDETSIDVTRRTALQTLGLGALGTALPGAADRSRAAAAAGGDWPQFGHDAANTGHNADATGIAEGPAERWRVTDDWDFWRTASVDGTVYACAGSGTFPTHLDGEVYAIGADGEREWTFTPEGRPHGTPAASGGRVYVGTTDETVYAVDAAEGTEQWRAETAGYPRQLTVADGVAYVGTSYRDGAATCYAFDAADGSAVWEFDAGGGVSAAPAVSGDTVFVHSGDGSAHGGDSDTLHALAVADGGVEWSHQRAAGGRAAPVVDDGTVFLGDADGTLYAFESDTGSETWTFDAGSNAGTTPAVANGTVFFAPLDPAVYALDAATGDALWEVTAGDDTTGLATDGDVLYVGCTDGRVYGLDAESGDQAWRYELDGAAQHPVVAGEDVYVGCGTGDLYALTGGGGDGG